MRRVQTILGTFLAAAVAATMLHPLPAAAWEPDKPIHIVVGFAPGGGTDIVARALVASSQELFPVPLVIENRAGAAGTLAADYVAKQPADGYTLLVAGGSESVSVPNHRELTFSLEDFEGIVRAIRSRLFIVSLKDSGIDSIDDLVEAAKARPGELAFASSGQGGIFHSTMLVLTENHDLDMKHVPYDGGAPAMAALLGGHVDITIGSPEEVQAQYDAGEINLLAVASIERSPLYPDVPTLTELGYDVYIENQKGLVAPAGLPEDVHAYLHDRFKQGIESQAWIDTAEKLKLETSYLSGPDFMEAMQSMSDNIGQAVGGGS